MPKATILLADNSHDFAEARAEILRYHGYEALIAFTPRQAKEVIERGRIDLAILDLRLTDDDDYKDHSGLVLAKEIDPAIPKIILTAYPSVDAISEALKPHSTESHPLAADFVSKSDGPEALLSSIEHILAWWQASETVNIELTLNQDFESFSAEEKACVLRILRELLDLPGEISVVAIEPGSTKLTIKLTREQTEQLFWLYERGVLDELHITDAKIIASAAANAIVRDKAQSNSYDVFMCHNSEDKPEVKRIALQLRRRSILPWLDEWALRPGLPWQQALEAQIGSIKSAAVFVGNSGIGPWQDM